MKATNLLYVVLILLTLPMLLLSQEMSTVSIYGTVTDSVSNQPLADVRVDVINEADSSERASAITGNDGRYSISLTTSSQSLGITDEFRLLQNYPNPFNPSTLIRFQLPQAGEVRLDIYNTLGQKIRTLLNRQLSPGGYTAEWDATNDAGVAVAAGIYFYRLRANRSVQTRKMVLMDGAAGRQSGVSGRPKTGGILTKSHDLKITIRASSPEIVPREENRIQVTSSSKQMDIDVLRLTFFLDRDKIIVSEPSGTGVVYVSGLPGALSGPLSGVNIITVTNLQSSEENSGLVRSSGSFGPITIPAAIGDRLMVSIGGTSQVFDVVGEVPPGVVESTPTDGDKDIIVDQIIIIRFSEPVQTETVTGGGFTIADSAGALVPGAITFDSNNTIATLDPVDPLAYNSSYTITVTTDVLDLQGLNLDSAYTATFTTEALGTLINVPGDVPTIQAGIDAASDGDTVLVADGTYLENINFKGKAITVASHYLVDGDTSHISNTIIDGSQPSNPDSGSVVSFVSGEDTTSVIYGFTITGGTGTITEYIWDGIFPIRAGGGVFCFDAGARIASNKITINNIPHNDVESTGAGIAALLWNNSDYVIIESNQIVNNTLDGTNSWGSALWLNNNGIIINNEISYNTSNADANAWGAVACGSDASHPRNVTIKDNIIRHNETNGPFRAFGGGVGIEGGTSALIIGNEISYNTLSSPVTGVGGGIEIAGLEGTTIIERNIISNNMVLVPNNGENGGGISLENNSANSNTSITNNIISNNSAYYGGGIRIRNSKAEIVNNTVVNNSATKGGGISSNTDLAKVINTIVWGNQSPNILGAPAVRYSNIQGGYAGEGNIDADPLFADTLSYNLSDSSLCIGAGIDSIQIGGIWYHAPPFDFDGDPRPLPTGSFPDIGAQESPRAFFVGHFAQLPWTKDVNNPVLRGAYWEWDRNILWPNVLYNFDSTRYEMWYSGSSSNRPGNMRIPKKIGFATSPDGINWTKHPNPVLVPDSGTWDESSVDFPMVIRENGQYEMWYTGWSPSDSVVALGYATSPDGKNWTKYGSNPVMTTSSANWDAGGVGDCYVMPIFGGYKMWYSGWVADYENGDIGYATSTDGINWIPYNNNPVVTHGFGGSWDDGVVKSPSVLRINNIYHLWYTGKRIGELYLHQIGWATSVDGINWNKYDDTQTTDSLYTVSDPVLKPGSVPWEWDGQGVHTGTVILEEDSLLHMWYSGVVHLEIPDLWRIGVATAPLDSVTGLNVDEGKYQEFRKRVLIK